MKTAIKQATNVILCLILISTLTACGAIHYGSGYRVEYDAAGVESDQAAFESGYAEGYADGFENGRSAAGVISEPADEGGREASIEPVESLESYGFVSVSEAVPDVILEIRYYSTYNFVGERISGYKEPIALLTKEAASALKEASDELLRQGYQLKIYDAYRPQSAVEHFKAWALDLEDTRMKAFFYPELDKSALFTKGYIASKSGHSRGSTVDVTLVDRASGKDVDMGSPFDYFGEISRPGYTADLTEEQVRNRGILRAAMLAHGFKGIGTEWWHFTLEDEPYPDTYFDFPVESGKS